MVCCVMPVEAGNRRPGVCRQDMFFSMIFNSLDMKMWVNGEATDKLLIPNWVLLQP